MIVIMTEMRRWLLWPSFLFLFFYEVIHCKWMNERKTKKNCWYDHRLCISTSLYTHTHTTEKGEIEISVKTRNRSVDVCRSSYQRHHCSQTPADHVYICSSALIGSTRSHSLWLRDCISILLMDLLMVIVQDHVTEGMVPLLGHDNETKEIAEGGEIEEGRDEISFSFMFLFRSPPFMHFTLRKLHIL